MARLGVVPSAVALVVVAVVAVRDVLGRTPVTNAIVAGSRTGIVCSARFASVV